MRHGEDDGGIVNENYTDHTIAEEVLGDIFKIIQHWLHSLPFQFLETSKGGKLGHC